MRLGFLFAFALFLAPSAWAAPLSAAEQADAGRIVEEVLAATEIPSASIAIVRDGELAFAGAYGFARLADRTPATIDTRYAIGSISKQFTAAAILLLQEEGRLNIDHTLSRYRIETTRADEITIRRILSHTAGYRDYWPQDFVPPDMMRPVEPDGILDRWARIPLDYEPGAEYRYSNTGFTIAGLIVERVARRDLHDFLQRRIFTPLAMASATEIDTQQLPDNAGHTRFGLGPVIAAPDEGEGWLWAIGELAMTPSDLARWNIALMNEGAGILRPESVTAMTARTPLTASGQSANYGLGLSITTSNGRRVWSHGGAVSGYLANNAIYPDERLAITVLTNGDFADATGEIAARLAFRFREQPPKIARARDTLAAFQRGEIDRSQFTGNGNAYFTDEAVRTIAETLAPFGEARLITLDVDRLRGGLTIELYTVHFATRAATIIVRAEPDGRMEQFAVSFGSP